MPTLIQTSEEKKLFDTITAYYNRLYPGIVFTKREAILDAEEIGDIEYTYPGEETEATFNEEAAMIEDALKLGYDAPIIILHVKGRNILLDGHRRVKVAWTKHMKWKAFVLMPEKVTKFGIERMILGKVREMFA